MIINQEPYMTMALKEAEKAANRDEVPVGAIIIDTTTGKVIAKAGNESEEKHDPTMHAEIVAIKQAAKAKKNSRLTNCDMYITLEPCPMCAQAISFARIRRLYFGAYDQKSGGVEHGARVFEASSCHHKPEIYGGINEKESTKLLKDFFIRKRV